MLKNSPKVGFLTASNPTDKRSWSGTYYHMFRALEGVMPDIVLLGPIPKNKKLERLLTAISIFHLKLFSRRYNKLHNILRSKFYAKRIENMLAKKEVDVIFAPAASTEIAFLNTPIPICYLSDTSFGQISSYYETFSDFSSLSLKESQIIEKRAIRRSHHLVFSSSWAADYVVKHYSANEEKITVLPFGPNTDFVPERQTLEKSFENGIQIIFAAKHWNRKGGDIVIKTFELLEKENEDLQLTILGCEPPSKITNNKIQVIPFLNKNIPEEEERFLNLFKEAHLFFLPTRADCTPVVLCEANAFGIPVITTATGGVPSLVEDGENGFALPLEAGPREYAQKIQELLDEPPKLKEMSEKSRAKFEKELNWGSWAAAMKDIFIKMANQ